MSQLRRLHTIPLLLITMLPFVLLAVTLLQKFHSNSQIVDDVVTLTQTRQQSTNFSIPPKIQILKSSIKNEPHFGKTRTIRYPKIKVYKGELPSANNKCSYKGKVFGIGQMKTGTTSLNAALKMLGYPCFRGSCKHVGMWNYLPDATLGWKPQSEIIDDILNIPALYTNFEEVSRKAHNFGDSPWLFMFPVFDIWVWKCATFFWMDENLKKIARGRIVSKE